MKTGDYCHAHRWHDKDPADPFAVGFLKEITTINDKTYYKLEGNGVPPRLFPHCEKITSEQGKHLLERNAKALGPGW